MEYLQNAEDSKMYMNKLELHGSITYNLQTGKNQIDFFIQKIEMEYRSHKSIISNQKMNMQERKYFFIALILSNLFILVFYTD